MKTEDIVVQSLLLILVAGCGPDYGSAERPVDLPSAEIAKIVDATGGAQRQGELPPYFVANVNNQTDWHLSELEMELRIKGNGVTRRFLGQPMASNLETLKVVSVKAMNPKSSGSFVFQIGNFLAWDEARRPTRPVSDEQFKAFLAFGSNPLEYGVEISTGKIVNNITGEPFEWRLVGAKGYRR